MGMNEMVRPYRQRVIVESLIRASVFGLFYGLCLTLLLAVGFRFIPDNKYGMGLVYILSAIGAGAACALVVGFIIYKKRYNHGLKELAKRMDHGSILINLSGRGDKDMDYIIENYGIR